ncbi:dnaJ-like protein subfamily C member 16 [Gossypium australe]|uniref:DnaJ-like protein subfamily C member 16 n=1 Tax=Gossypium australe TaxID=47621 RepID=A0A5B6UIA3_9ROSI|nr:dnaJ-like protein subfamily C member 16 [Gossypium australe]
MAGDSATKIKAYAVPAVLFSLSMLYQLVLLPRAFPPSHYDVLGLKTYCSMEEVKEAYENLESKWNSGLEIPTTTEFIKIRYAYELLTNPIWKRNYDVFGINEQDVSTSLQPTCCPWFYLLDSSPRKRERKIAWVLDYFIEGFYSHGLQHVLEKLSQQYAGKKFSNIALPLLCTVASDTGDDAFNVITSKEFQSMFQDSKPWLLQVYSSGSNQSAQFANSWKRIAALLNGVANIGMVELGEVHVAAYLSERKPMGRFFFRNGLPSVVAFPSGCKTSDCLIRFEGELSVDAVTDWFAMAVLNLPRIFYYSKESLGPRFLAKSSPHKVKVIFFSKTGERATPAIRQAARDYWNYATFACVLWREEEFSVWWNTFEVESAPAVVFLKDPGLKPLVYHGSVNDSWFLDVLEQNKQQGIFEHYFIFGPLARNSRLHSVVTGAHRIAE